MSRSMSNYRKLRLAIECWAMVRTSACVVLLLLLETSAFAQRADSMTPGMPLQQLRIRDCGYDWPNEEVPWIITDEERAAFKKTRNDEERVRFIEQFWDRRDPTPATLENEFRDAYYERI